MSGGDSDESVAGHNYYRVGNISRGNNGAGNYTTYEISMVNDNGQWKATESCHKSSSNVYSAEQISYYKRANIRYSFEKTSQGMKDDDIKKLQSESGVTIIASSQYDLSSSNIDGKGNLYDYINKCLLGSMNCDSDKNTYGKLKISGGTKDSVDTELMENFYHIFTQNYNEENIERKIEYTKTSAPVKLGDVVGKCNYFYEGKNIGSVDVIAKNGVNKMSFGHCLKKVFEKWYG